MVWEKSWRSPTLALCPVIVGGLCGNAPLYLRLGNYKKITFPIVGNQMLCGSLEEGHKPMAKVGFILQDGDRQPSSPCSEKGRLDQVIRLDTWLFGLWTRLDAWFFGCWSQIRGITASLGRGSRIVSWFLCRKRAPMSTQTSQGAHFKVRLQWVWNNTLPAFS